jgi:hypothetical protein
MVPCGITGIVAIATGVSRRKLRVYEYLEKRYVLYQGLT